MVKGFSLSVCVVCVWSLSGALSYQLIKQTISVIGAGIAQWLERRTRDWKVAGSNPCWNGGRIFFSRVDFLCWLLFRYPFHPCVTTVARKKSRSFCQKCRWQVTAKHAYTLRIEPCFGIGHNLSLICQMTSEDIKHQLNNNNNIYVIQMPFATPTFSAYQCSLPGLQFCSYLLWRKYWNRRLRMETSEHGYVVWNWAHNFWAKLQALVYDIFPSTTAIFSDTIGSRKLS